nr:DnaJ domain-containing protein [Burkholderiales bacterium]
MRPAKTLYDALGLDATATTEQVTARAASLLERLNSDGAAHSEDRANQIKIIAYARETLSDPAKRARYDQSLQRQAAVVVEQVSSTPAPAGTPMTHWLLFAVGAAAMAGAYFFYQQKRAAPAPVAAPVASTSAPVRVQPVPTDNTQINAVPQQAPPAPLATGAPAVTSATTGELSAAEVFRRNQNSIVVVRGNREDGRGVTQGSGVVIEDAEVVTNCHVALGTTNLVVIAGGKSLPAR